ncbi:MAG: hypothetical protein ACRD43_01630 [Pyrinomonadaceae bacterium]
MKNYTGRFIAVAVLAAFCAQTSLAQRSKPKKGIPAKARPAIFSVIYDGKGIEPIAFVENGKLVASGGDSGADESGLAATYYKVGAKYDLIFGGVPSGTVTVSKSNVGTDCGGSSADVSVSSSRSLKGFVMGLATNITPRSKGSGLRRSPTTGERSEIEALVRAEYAKHKVPASTYKQLHYHNLTAVDVDNDGVAELIGSYWVAPKTTERGLLFFIAEKGSNGKYAFNYSDYQSVTPDKVMSGNMKDLDDGIYQTLLLDTFDYDGDGTAEIFTIGKAFEGNNYSVFKRTGGKWTKALDAYDYRCGY